jgi:hypothetical protein
MGVGGQFARLQKTKRFKVTAAALERRSAVMSDNHEIVSYG